MSIHEIVLPETKPETEWVRGRAVQKVSPTYSHARLQSLLTTALGEWAENGGHGRVGTEWRFRVAPPGEIVRPLVPDVAFLAYTALPADAAPELFEVPLGAPTVAVEVLSPDDRPANVAHKVKTYLAAGASLVAVFDGHLGEVTLHDATGARVLSSDQTLTHRSLPGFSLDLKSLFERARR